MEFVFGIASAVQGGSPFYQTFFSKHFPERWAVLLSLGVPFWSASLWLFLFFWLFLPRWREGAAPFSFFGGKLGIGPGTYDSPAGDRGPRFSLGSRPSGGMAAEAPGVCVCVCVYCVCALCVCVGLLFSSSESEREREREGAKRQRSLFSFAFLEGSGPRGGEGQPTAGFG